MPVVEAKEDLRHNGRFYPKGSRFTVPEGHSSPLLLPVHERMVNPKHLHVNDKRGDTDAVQGNV